MHLEHDTASFVLLLLRLISNMPFTELIPLLALHKIWDEQISFQNDVSKISTQETKAIIVQNNESYWRIDS